jgi:TonB family protein
MITEWAQWQGEVVDGEFHLDRYLGGSAHSGVFQTEFHGQKAAIKILSDEPRHQWGAELSHPNLIRIFRTGRWQVDDRPMHYIVMEAADEVLSQVIADRPLTSEEAREMLSPVLNALSFLHGRGLVHGRIKPGNIMSAGEQLKISSDGLRQAGEAPNLIARGTYDAPEMGDRQVSAALDVWALGVTLVEVLTQRFPESDQPGGPMLPEPFGEIVKHCLERDPQSRWTVAEISARLSGGAAPAPVLLPPRPEPAEPAPVSNRRPLGIAAAAVVAVLAVVGGSRLFRSRPPQNPPAAVASREAAPPAPPAPVTAGPADSVAGKVAKQVAPQVTNKARESVQGTVKVVVRVRVNSAGAVASAKLESRHVSRYFERAALQAARRWRFTPPKADGHAVSSSWLLEFDFGQSGTEMHARPVS